MTVHSREQPSEAGERAGCILFFRGGEGRTNCPSGIFAARIALQELTEGIPPSIIKGYMSPKLPIPKLPRRRRNDMEIFKKIRENNRTIAVLAKWQKSIWFPVVYATLGVFACSFGMAAYLPIYYLFMLATVFGAFFCDDVKVLLVPLLLSYFTAGGDGLLSFGEAITDISLFFNPAGLLNMCIAGGIMVAAILFRLFADGTVADIFRKRGVLTVGMVCLAAAFFLNGAISAKWEPLDLAYGIFMAVGLLAMYFIVLSISNRSQGIVRYVCALCLLCGLMICAEEWILMIKLAADGKLLETDGTGNWTGGFVRDYQVLGWGVSTYAAGALAFLIPPTMALAYKCRRGWLYYLAALAMYLTIVLLNARTSMLFGAVILAACAVFCCFGPNKRGNRIVTVSAVAAALLAIAVVWAAMGTGEFFDFIANMLRFDQGDNERFERWANGLRDFLSAPIFGVGFMDGAASAGNMYSNMYHNIFVEFLGATGIVGMLAFLFHIIQSVELCVRKFHIERMLVVFGALAIILTSFLDNFFFMFGTQMFYGALLAVAEIQLEGTRAEQLSEYKRIPAGRKPRIVFTFIEAGMGHIIPETAVADAMEKKYGDAVEVVRSRFYQETGNAAMKKFELSLVKPVEKQSRSRIYGRLCVLGNQLFGDTVAHEFVMRIRGPYSVLPAIRYLEELDADIVFPTHWATTYYIGKMRKNRPYSVLFCPDAYSNGMFNMDCNDFLMPTREGLNKANEHRMYAGGNGSVVRYPVRGEAFSLLGKREEIRRKLGIPSDRFVVVLADGGYGMAKLEVTVRELVRSSAEMTVVAVCGKNAEGVERLKKLECAGGIDLRVYGFTDSMLELVSMADLFVGKSGANSMAEPAFFGLPIIVTKCITPIERNIMKYYTRVIGNALFIPSAKKAAEKICFFAENRGELNKYASAAKSFKSQCGAEDIADLLYDRAVNRCRAVENEWREEELSESELRLRMTSYEKNPSEDEEKTV